MQYKRFQVLISFLLTQSDRRKLHRRMVYCESSLSHHLFQVAVTQGIPQVPPYTQQDDVRLKVTPLEGVLWVHGRCGLGHW